MKLTDSSEELRDNPKPKPVGLGIKFRAQQASASISMRSPRRCSRKPYRIRWMWSGPILDDAAQGSRERKMLGARACAGSSRSASTWV
jgi:hypothetical protein